MADVTFDAIVIGAGHNGLVAANYLAAVGMPLRPIAGYLKSRGMPIDLDIDKLYSEKVVLNWHDFG